MARSKHLDCGCCGTYFKTWPNYKDQDQDQGYGICCDCQVDAAWKEHEMLTDIIATLASGLNEKNRAKYLAFDRPRQEMIVYDALDKGILKWTIGRAA